MSNGAIRDWTSHDRSKVYSDPTAALDGIFEANSRIASGSHLDYRIRHMSSEELLKRVTVDPQVCHGKSCIRCLRYPVTMLLELMSSGMTHDEILTDHQDLERDDLFAALAYAARLSDARRVALA